MFRRIPVFVLLGVLALSVACTNKKVKNPIANVDSKQPDKVLFDRAMEALKRNRFDVARLSLQTLINTYPDSEFIARAKLGVADSWYVEGGSAAMAQAELEYNDFKTFFPNMPEAAEAQLRIGDIHYHQMEKPDRDFTHAMRAEQEYRNLIMQFPDSKLVPEAKQRLLEVQEVLADREFGIGRFYYLRPSYPAAIARMRSLVDRYPLYSKADEALYLLGQSYEAENALLMKPALPDNTPAAKARDKLVDEFTNKAAEAYSQILTRYPAMAWAGDAKERLEALHKPVPKPTKAMYALNKKEMESRVESGTVAKLMGSFRKHPDVSRAAKGADPVLVDPALTSASDVIQQATQALTAGPGASAGTGTLAVETIGNGAPPPGGPVPHSGSIAPVTNPQAVADAKPAPNSNELVPNTAPDPNELKPNVSTVSDPNLPPPTQVNQINAADQGNQTANATNAGDNDPADVTYSSSKHKKKKGLRKVVPF